MNLYEQGKLNANDVQFLKEQLTYPIVKFEGMLVKVQRKKTEKTEYLATAISFAFKVKAVILNVETGVTEDEISMKTYFGEKEIRIDRGVLCKRRFDEVSTYGLVYDSAHIIDLVHFIHQSENFAAAISEYSYVGWIKSKEELSFYGYDNKTA